jgi:hypothetical protein
VALQQGANVTSGDIVDVGPGGQSLVTYGHNAMSRFNEQSSVRVFRCSNTVTLQLLHGQMTFRSTPQQPVEGRIGDATIRSADGQEAVGLVSLVTPTLATVAAERGTLAVSTAGDGKSALVRAGETQRIALSLTEQGAPLPVCGAEVSGVTATKVTTAVLLGAATLGVGLGLSRNEPKPNCTPTPPVSPFMFPCK